MVQQSGPSSHPPCNAQVLGLSGVLLLLLLSLAHVQVVVLVLVSVLPVLSLRESSSARVSLRESSSARVSHVAGLTAHMLD
jgi:hypothetical protein